VVVVVPLTVVVVAVVVTQLSHSTGHKASCAAIPQKAADAAGQLTGSSGTPLHSLVVVVVVAVVLEVVTQESQSTGQAC
jgi:hypothetical protein